MKPKPRIHKLFNHTQCWFTEQDVYDICRVQRPRVSQILSDLVEEGILKMDPDDPPEYKAVKYLADLQQPS